MLIKILFILCIVSNVQAQPHEDITTGDIKISVIGNSNSNQVSIGTAQTTQPDKHSIKCGNIEKVIIGNNSSIQLSLPDKVSSICKDKK